VAPSPKPRTGKKLAFPGFVLPALAMANGDNPPSGSEWLHEVKFDGYRIQLHILNETVSIYTRRGFDWTDRFRKIAADANSIRAKSAIIDGEIVVPNQKGVSDFSQLQKSISAHMPSDKIAIYAFDLLFLDGNDVRALPLVERRAMLKRLVSGSKIRMSEGFDDGERLFKRACEMGLEGVVSKRRNSRYRSGRTMDWIKVTCRLRETLAIIGYSLKGRSFDGLYLARSERGKLVYAGKVDHGFDRENIADLLKRMLKLGTRSPAISIRKTHGNWIKPVLLAEIEYRGKSEGHLRHAFFKGLREDMRDTTNGGINR
jgi:bifunctional non-homologous end joining protein LigD